MKLKPLNDYVIIKRIADAEKTKTGIFIPDVAKGADNLCRGEVTHIPDTESCTVKKGTIVLYDTYRAVIHKMEGIEYHFIEWDKLICIIGDK